jgi:cardiolipin synthase
MTDWTNWIIAAATIAWGIFGIWAAAHALTNKRDPRSALGWSATCLLLPYLGPLAYLLFGINRIGSHARRLGHFPAYLHPLATPKNQRADLEILPSPLVSRFIGISDRITHRPLIGGNQITPFFTGDEAYREMIDEIKRAKRSVLLATYIFRTDQSGKEFLSALQDAVERGVKVRVLIDGAGELYSYPRMSKKLTDANVENALFNPLRLFPPSFYLNLRNHRKILVCDGATGFAGGMNIGDQHVTNKRGRIPDADVHFRLQGPVVEQLEKVFVEDWKFATSEHISGSALPPADIDPDFAWARVIADGPNDELGKLALIIETTISAAQHSIRIVTPYFLPTKEMIAALKSAALRGVQVDIVLPEKSNLRYVDWATRNMLWEILKWDVNVYYQPPPFAHTKLFVVDKGYLHIGSANIDPRSLRLNFEVAVEIISEELGEQLTRHIDDMIGAARRVTLAEVDSRKYVTRLRDSLAWLFSPYL